jgi:uncharacterized protein
MTNRLVTELSPYLQQHAHNPVDWYPWCNEAFEEAKRENRPVLVSIGYSACHWCHVMERESFENEEVAAFMNAHFICIKVDREEHPDVDHFYMDAVQAITGSGGWPLNVFVTPDRLPIYGGTYFPPRPGYGRPSWTEILYRIAEVWNTQPEQMALQSRQLTEHLQQVALHNIAAKETRPDSEFGSKTATALLKIADKKNGGFGNAPKFPATMAITFLLEHYRFTGYEPALEHALRSLDAMAAGGIYDQLGGGFARYATDSSWLVPHFEKMLYDNALLIAAYCDAYHITRNEQYSKIVRETISFVERELQGADGNFYCAIDADSEGIEGRFYTWSWQELQDLLTDELQIVAAWYGAKEGGNWEHTNILHTPHTLEAFASQNAITVEELLKKIETAKTKLFQERAQRIRPTTDNKCLLSWNGLMNLALTKAGIVLNEQAYIRKSAAHMQAMLDGFQENSNLLHCRQGNVAKIPAKLDDYACLIQAMLKLAELTEDDGLIDKAISLTENVLDRFSAPDTTYFYYSDIAQSDIPVRKTDVYDGATPAANAVMANNLMIAGLYAENTDWINRSREMVFGMSETVLQYPYSYGYWAMLIQRHIIGIKTVICDGKDAEENKTAVLARNYPHVSVVSYKKIISEKAFLESNIIAENNSIFVCEEQKCLLPVNSISKAFEIIENKL